MAEDVRGIVMGKINDTARRLLREMGYQAEGSPTLDVLPREAALVGHSADYHSSS